MFLTESTSDNSGHTATLRYAKIDSLRSPTSYGPRRYMPCQKGGERYERSKIRN